MLRSGLSISLLWMIFGFVPIARAANHETHLAKQPQAVKEFGQLPLSFTANEGQYSPDVRFQTRGSAYAISLARHEAIFRVAWSKPKRPLSVSASSTQVRDDARDASADIRMQFLGASNDAVVSGAEELPGAANFLIGNNPSNWRTGVPTYAKVKYTGLYPGIDLVYYGTQRQLEFDFIVQSGSDPNCIKLRFESNKTRKRVLRRIDRSGDLLIGDVGSEFRLPRPVVYQSEGDASQSSEKHLIDAGYVLSGANEVRFRIGAYDKSRPLVIDPTVAYSTLVGGDNSDESFASAVDSGGNVYITGQTFSEDYPLIPGTIQTPPSNNYCFVTKINSAGTAILYSSVFGASHGYTSGTGIAVDISGEAYVTGTTSYSDFPTTAGAFLPHPGVTGGGFLVKLNASATAFVYSTYLSAGSRTLPYALSVDATGSAYITGRTGDSNFPTTTGGFQSAPDANILNNPQAFVTKFSPSGSGQAYSTLLGPLGSTADSIAVDRSGNAFVAGYTSATNFPTTSGALAESATGNGPLGFGFVTKLSSTGSSLLYSTYVPGSAVPYGIAVDLQDNAFITGSLPDSSLVTTPTAFRTSSSGGYDAFVTKLNAAGSGLLYSTYLGGSQSDQGNSIAVDADGNAYIGGFTKSPDFPTTQGTFQNTYGGGDTDAFFTKLDAAGSVLLYSSYLGGGEYDYATSIAIDPIGNAYLTGTTGSGVSGSLRFPVTANALRKSIQGVGYDSFVTKFTFGSLATATQTITFGVLPDRIYGVRPLSLNATASSGLPVLFTATGPVAVSGNKLTIQGVGAVTVTALQPGNTDYSAATPVAQSFTVNKAVLHATANDAIRSTGTPNPPLTYTLTGFSNSDTPAVVSGVAIESTIATTTSAAGTYPITFKTKALTAANYSFIYVPGALTVTSRQCETISNYAGGFSSTAGLSLNHGATVKGGLLQLTDGGIFEGRSAFYTSPILITDFATDFMFQILNPVADGFTFTVQSNNPGVYGHSGGDLGYTGIPHSAAIKFDIHNNQGEGPGSMGFYQNGVLPTVPDVNLVPAGIDLHSGHVFRVHIGYASANIAVTITDTQTNASKFATFPGDLSNTVGTGAYVGFTAGTGQGTAIQNILSWSFSGGPGCH